MKKIFSRTRIYEDIAFSIEEQISKGVLKAGMKLPTVKELADKHRVSVPTVLKAIALLKTRGIVKTIWGGGSYVQDTEKDKTLANTATIVVSNTETYNTDPKVRVYWDQIYSRNLLGIQSEAFHLGIRNSNIFLPETLLNAPDELRQFLAVHTKDAQGSLCLWPNLSDVQAENLVNALDCPIIFDNTFGQLKYRNAVTIDTYVNAYNIMNHLFSCGYSRIASITGFNLDYFYYADRLRAYYKCLNDHAAKVDKDLVFCCDESTTSITETCNLLLDRLTGNESLAVFCFNDYRAIILLREAQKRGIAIPQQLAIAGFDGSDTAIETGITTIRLPYEYIGKQAMELLTAIVKKQVDSPAEQRISSGVLPGWSTIGKNKTTVTAKQKET